MFSFEDREIPLSMIQKGETGRLEEVLLAMASFTLRNFCTNIVCAFLAFVRSNAVNVNDGKMWNLGQNGNYWSRTAASSTNARNLGMNTTDVGPSNSNNRWNGFSLRWWWPRCGADLLETGLVNCIERSRKGNFTKVKFLCWASDRKKM